MPLAANLESADSDSLIQAIITAIADREGVDITEVEPPAYDPLYTVINPEALETLFATRGETDGRVVFTYEGYEVTVHSSGAIDVADSSNSTR